MQRQSRAGRRLLAASTGLVLALSLLGAGQGLSAQAAQDVIVNPEPEYNQPRVLDGRVYSIDSSGPLVAVAGTFTRVRVGDFSDPEQNRQWVFIYNRSTGEFLNSFDPQVRGDAPVTSGDTNNELPGVEAVQFAADGQSVYLAGDFDTVNGQPTQNIARVDLNGDLVAGFSAAARGRVNDMALAGGRLIVGGRFGELNGQSVSKLGSLDPTTGALQGDFNVQAMGSRSDDEGAFVLELDVSASRRWLVVGGNFLNVGGAAREQVALIDLRGTPAVSNWSTQGYANDCNSNYDDTWIRGLDISPDSSYLVVSTTGAYVGPDVLCDTAARFELPPYSTGGNQEPTWLNHTGGDTFFANEITESAVYVGGHTRWVNNQYPTRNPGATAIGDDDGPGSVERPGFSALDPASGAPLSFNPGRERGRGIEALHVDGQTLFVGHDTNYFFCDSGTVEPGAGDCLLRQRLAVLTTAGGKVNPQPEVTKLPVELHYSVGDALFSRSFNGTTLGGQTTVSGSGWNGLRDGFVQADTLHYFGGSDAFFSRPFSGSSIGGATNLSTSVGYVDANRELTPYDQPYGVAETEAAAYYNGRIYYTRSDKTGLYSRGYSVESGIINTNEIQISGADLSDIVALDFVNGTMYAASTDGNLYAYNAPQGQLSVGSRRLIDNGSSGTNWATIGGLFSFDVDQASEPRPVPTPEPDVQPQPQPQPADTRAPTVTITKPKAGKTQVDQSVRITGIADDDTEIAEVRLSVFNRVDSSKRRWLKPDGRWAKKFTFRNPKILQPGNPRVSWETRISLPSGTYGLNAVAYDAAGKASKSATRKVVVDAKDKRQPGTKIKSASNKKPGKSVKIKGTAFDDQAVRLVKVKVKKIRRANGQRNVTFLKPNGKFGNKQRYVRANLSKDLAQFTRWKLRFKLSRRARYRVIAEAVDANYRRDKLAARIKFRIGG